MEPLVSIIIPCFNAESFIEEAVSSALNQTYKNIEIIIVDDGSRDNTLSLLNANYRSFENIQILTHPGNKNLGVSKTRSLGIEFSRGRYIAYLDADDIFLPSKIETQIKVFQENPSVVLVHSAASCQVDNGSGEVFHNEFRFRDEDYLYSLFDFNYLQQNTICNSSAVVSREALRGLKNAFQQVFQYEDWVNWILLAQKGKFCYINAALVRYRYHAKSSTYELANHNAKAIYAKLEMLFILITRTKDKKVTECIYENIDYLIMDGISNYDDSQPYANLFQFHFRMLLKIFRRKFRSVFGKNVNR